MGGDERSLGRKCTSRACALQQRRSCLGGGGPPVMTEPPAPTDHAWRPARFMVIAAHPDDADFGPAGTAARWIDAGSEGWLVCCTSGDQGGEDPDADPLELAALRETEQQAAATIIGYAGRHLPPPARRGPGQRPAAARAAGPRDPDLPAGRGPGHGPGHALLQGRRDQPHRPSGGRDRRGRRRLPGGPQPDGLPVRSPGPGWRRIASAGCTCSGPIGPTRGSTSAPRSTARSMRCAPTPARSTTPTGWPSGSGAGRPRRAPDRGDGGRGAAPGRHRRRRG